jgi:hypothetical protein
MVSLPEMIALIISSCESLKELSPKILKGFCNDFRNLNRRLHLVKIRNLYQKIAKKAATSAAFKINFIKIIEIKLV